MEPEVTQMPVQSGKNRKRFLILGGAFVLVVLSIYFLASKPFGFLGKSYSQVYALVDDKISQSAAIVINLPKGVAKEGAEQRVSFSPDFSGRWISTEELPNALAFMPDKPLAIGGRFAATLKLDQGAISKDFVIDEDPKVLEVFPRSDSEADENSSITIVFNRPMVPLTTLSELEKAAVPIEITPKTEGKFKWISTKTLQFTPKDRLAYSAHYSVKIISGFASTDGVPVPPAEYKFTTRALRYEGSTGGTILYDQPIDVRFNVPINLDRTVSGLVLKNEQTGLNEPYVAEYGRRYEYDSSGKPKSVIIDRSVLSIFPMADRNGRSRIWNFSGVYSISLANAYPLDGDINFSGAIKTKVSVTPALKSLTASSEKTNLASPNLFDPQGNLIVEFYEDINLDKSEISAKGLKKTRYGEKCEENASDSRMWRPQDDTCKKVDDKSKIIISFDPSAFAKGEKFKLNLNKIVNALGLNVNSAPISENIAVYPELKILSLTPKDNSAEASLMELYLCTNSPLVPKDRTNFKESIQTSSYLVFNRFDNPYLRQADPEKFPSNIPCNVGEYVNRIRYGLHPEIDYAIHLSFDDVFGQKVSRDLRFKTGKPPAFYSRFHNLQKIYNVTTPDKTIFTYATENLEYVNLHICKITPATLLSYLNTRPSQTASNEVLNCVSTKTATIDLPKIYWVNNYFQIDLRDYFADPKGQYVISFSNPRYAVENSKWRSDSGQPLYDRTFVSVTNLAVGEKKTQWTKYDNLPEMTEDSFNASGSLANLYWVSAAKTLNPIVGANVLLYRQVGDYNGPIVADVSRTTGSDGVAKLPLTKDVVGAVVTTPDDSAIISSWTDNLSWAGYATGNRLIYAYTDRPIYRPGQDVYLKGIYRFQYDGRLDMFEDKDIPVAVYNPKGEAILNQNLQLSEFGTFVTHFKLPSEAPLGSYRIEARDNYFFFDVAEYQGAAFEAAAVSDKEEYIAGETAKISVLGKYYFGVPLAGGKLQYTWTAQDYYFDRYTDEYFNFGNDWYYCAYCGYGDSYIGSGETSLDIAGNAEISETFDFAKLFKDESFKKSKIIVFHGTIQDLSGKSVSFQKSFIVHRGKFYLGAKVEPSFAPVNQPVTLRVKTVDTLGEPTSEGGIVMTASKVEWKSAKRQEVDGGFYARYERVLTQVVTDKLSTNGKGDGSLSLAFKEPGEYQISLKASDNEDNQISADTSVYIYGSGTVSIEPRNNETLDVTTEKKDLKVGEKAKIIIKSPYPNAKALISVERGRIFKYEVVNISQSLYEYEVPIEESYIPNVFVSVLLLSPNPEVKFGQVEFSVNNAEKALNVDVTTDKTSYLPGEKVTLTIKTTDYKGQAKPAEVSVAVADLSVLALKGNPKKNPLVFFYNGLPLTVTTASNVKNILHETEIPSGTKGGDGGDAEDLARKKRGEFKDTAFFEGKALTDSRGMATLTFTLPDNLTRWQVESLGVTKDTLVGVNYKEITAAKKVMAVPLAPRFIVPGDEFSIGANVFNQTDKKQSLSVKFASQTLEISGGATESVNLKPGESTTLYFNVTAPSGMAAGEHKFTIAAIADDYEDTVEKTIPIKRNETYESVATAGSTKSETAEEYIFIPDGVLTDRGGVNVRAQASLAFFLKDAIAYLAQFPYGCSEQLASKLDMLAVLQKANSIKGISGRFTIPSVEFDGASYSIQDAVSKGLSRIYENQDASGGFSYYAGMKPDTALTVHLVGVLANLKEAGFAVSDGVLDRAATFVADTLAKRGTLYYTENPQDVDNLIMAAYTLSGVRNRPANFYQITSIIGAKISASYLSDKISSGALAYLALLVSREPSLKPFEANVWKTLDNRTSIDSRGAYLKSNSRNIRYEYYETPIKNSALLLRAISERGIANSQVDSLLRWLLASRDNVGAWGSTNTTLEVIRGVVSYLAWSKEGESSFSLAVSLDDAPVAKQDFKGDSLFKTLEKFLPVSQFEQNKNHRLLFAKTNNVGSPSNFYYDIGLTYYLPVEQLPPRDEGIMISRSYYSLTDTKKERPLSEAKVGDVVRGEIRVVTPSPRPLFAIENFIPAGLELIDFNLATEDQSVIDYQSGSGAVGEANGGEKGAFSSLQFGNLTAAASAAYDDSLPQIYAEDLMIKGRTKTLVPDFKELHDDSLFLFKQNLPAGEYVYEFYARATNAGVYRELPAVARALYFPEIFGRTAGGLFTVKQ